MPVAIKKASDIERYVKLLVYGDPGIGKTTFAATGESHPQMKNTLFVNIEGGMLSIANTDADATEQLHNVDSVEEVFWNLAQKTKGWDHYQTVVVDSATELQTMDLEGIVKAAKKKNKSRNLDDIYLEDYGKSTARLKRIFRQFRDLPMHVIVTCLTKRVMPANAQNMTNPQPKATLPSLTDKLAMSLMGYMDFVWYMYIGEDNKRELLTRDKSHYKAKTRGARFSKALGERVVEPDLAEIFNLLLQTETGTQS